MDKNNLLIFESPEFGQVRSTLIDGEPWFIAADVCKALDIGNSRMALSRLEEDEKGVSSIDTLGGTQKMQRINEAGLYSLILTSRKPEAKAFKRWITHEVIPSIRKHGAYITDAVLDQMDEHPELISEYIRQLREENTKARELRQQLDRTRTQLLETKPKAAYYDRFVSDDDLTCFRYTAKEIGVPQGKLMGYMLEHGYLYRDHNRQGRAFPRAGKQNERFFRVRDFYDKRGRKSEYTLVTPAGKQHLFALSCDIRAWKPPEKDDYDTTGEQESMAALFVD